VPGTLFGRPDLNDHYYLPVTVRLWLRRAALLPGMARASSPWLHSLLGQPMACQSHFQYHRELVTGIQYDRSIEANHGFALGVIHPRLCC
jgi:hypothetical protein